MYATRVCGHAYVCTMHDYAWLCMAMHDYVWLCMAMQVLCMYYAWTMHDYTWLFMNMHDYVWLCMAMHGYASTMQVLCMYYACTMYGYACTMYVLCMYYAYICMTIDGYAWLCMHYACTMHGYACTMYYAWLCMTMYDYACTMHGYVCSMHDYAYICMTIHVYIHAHIPRPVDISFDCRRDNATENIERGLHSTLVMVQISHELFTIIQFCAGYCGRGRLLKCDSKTNYSTKTFSIGYLIHYIYLFINFPKVLTADGSKIIYLCYVTIMYTLYILYIHIKLNKNVYLRIKNFLS